MQRCAHLSKQLVRVEVVGDAGRHQMHGLEPTELLAVRAIHPHAAEVRLHGLQHNSAATSEAVVGSQPPCACTTNTDR